MRVQLTHYKEPSKILAQTDFTVDECLDILHNKKTFRDLPFFEKLDKCSYPVNMQSYDALIQSFHYVDGKLLFSSDKFKESRYGFKPSDYKKKSTMEIN